MICYKVTVKREQTITSTMLLISEWKKMFIADVDVEKGVILN